MKRILLGFLLNCLITLPVFSQEPVYDLRRVLNILPVYKDSLLNFYSLNNFSYHWLTPGRKNLRQFLNDFNNHHYLLSDTAKYDIPFIRDMASKRMYATTADSVFTELKISMSVLNFYKDILLGADVPSFAFKAFTPETDLTGLHTLIINAKLDSALNSSTYSDNKILRDNIHRLHTLIKTEGSIETPVTSRTISLSNKPLLQKLYFSGLTDSVNAVKTQKDLLNKIKEAQQLYNLLPDGVFRQGLLEALNVPVTKRLAYLRRSRNYNLWLKNLSKTQPVIVVNIPAAEMKVLKNEKVLFEMKMVLGKKSTPTPALLSRVNEVILYPYWHVPQSIATKELLPRIKRDPGYINRGNYQVLDKSGNIVDPYKINWHRPSTSYFQYLIRQSTGCDNALGLLKLNFANPYSVYLHDTPDKQGFLLSKRFLSHGCMRMEKPFELGRLILEPNTIAIDTLTQKGCLINQAPVHVNAINQMPVVAWHNPVGISRYGKLVFYEDVYGKFD